MKDLNCAREDQKKQREREQETQPEALERSLRLDHAAQIDTNIRRNIRPTAHDVSDVAGDAPKVFPAGEREINHALNLIVIDFSGRLYDFTFTTLSRTVIGLAR
jgi:hypothetical protein